MALGSKLYLLIVSFFILSLAQAQTNDDSLFIKKISDSKIPQRPIVILL